MRRLLLFACLSAGFAAFGLNYWPDYFGIVMPPNIAPFCFRVSGKGSVSVRMNAANGESMMAKVDSSGAVSWDAARWRELLAASSSNFVSFDVSCGEERECLSNYVAAAAIDSHLVYRLIPPGYTGFGEIGIYSRNLSSYAEKALYRNVQCSYRQCVNCHVHNRARPDEYLRHLRIVEGGTVIASPKYGKRKVDLSDVLKWTDYKRMDTSGKGSPPSVAYPAWHPSGDYIAFSINETRQFFRSSGKDLIEVVDLSSDLMVYSLADSSAIPVESGLDAMETYPAWSNDGRTLYSCRAIVPFKPDDSIASIRSAADSIRYEIVSRDFDAKTRKFSEPKKVFSDPAKSATLPRIVPGSRWMVFTLADHGNFHIWHNDADLYLLDLETGKARAIEEVNSPFAESYHSFTHDGKWMVFSTRRDDGSFTRPYFTYFNAEDGTFSKPFSLPWSDPDASFLRMNSYNVPEFSNGEVR